MLCRSLHGRVFKLYMRSMSIHLMDLFSIDKGLLQTHIVIILSKFLLLSNNRGFLLDINLSLAISLDQCSAWISFIFQIEKMPQEYLIN